MFGKLQLIGAAAAFGLAGASLAQTQGTPSETASSGASSSASSGGMMMSDHHRASKLINMNVQSAAGESLGKVQELVLDKTGKVTHVIVGQGGTLGMGEKLTAIPWQQASSKLSGQNIILEKERLQGAPTFANNKWPNLTSQNWSSQIDRYWSSTRAGTMRMSSSGGAAATEQTTSGSPPPPSGSQPSGSPSQGTGQAEAQSESPPERR